MALGRLTILWMWNSAPEALTGRSLAKSCLWMTLTFYSKEVVYHAEIQKILDWRCALVGYNTCDSSAGVCSGSRDSGSGRFGRGRCRGFGYCRRGRRGYDRGWRRRGRRSGCRCCNVLGFGNDDDPSYHCDAYALIGSSCDRFENAGFPGAASGGRRLQKTPSWSDETIRKNALIIGQLDS